MSSTRSRPTPWFPRIATLWLAASVSLAAPAMIARGQDAPPWPAPRLGDTSTLGRDVQRTMRLLATSRPEARNTVRILFYGQSITEQGWSRMVADDLRARFPSANLIIENRAIGGHSSQRLVKTAEADLYPFQPDLVIFHVYGSHIDYERIIRHVRERTTAEILQQNDHVTRPEDLTEESDPARLEPSGEDWNAFMNHDWLPHLAQRYGTELCDQRAIWKTYLADQGLRPSDLLKDGVHLNQRGEALMAACVMAYLRFDPALGPATADQWVKTFESGKDLMWDEGTLRLSFEGSSVVAVARPDATAATAEVLIDGKAPSDWPSSYAITRSSAYPGMNWPCLLRVGSQAPLVAETWTANLTDIADDCASFRFAVRGSVTGDDGDGTSSEPFVSRSGRVVIEPDDWNLAYARKVRPDGPPPADGFTVQWQAVMTGVDTYRATSPSQPGLPSEVTLVQGLPNEHHVLEIRSEEGPIGLQALRVYAPPLKPRPPSE